MNKEAIKLLKDVQGLWIELHGEAYFDLNGGQDFDKAIALLESKPDYLKSIESISKKSIAEFLRDWDEVIQVCKPEDSSFCKALQIIQHLKKTIEDFGNDSAGFDWAVIDRIDRLTAAMERCIKAMEGSNCLELEWLENALKGEPKGKSTTEEMIPRRYKNHSAKIIEIMKRHGKDRRAIVKELKDNGIVAKSTYWGDVSFVRHIIDEICPRGFGAELNNK